MDFDMNVEFLRMAFWQIVMVAGPILAVALGIGLFIGIISGFLLLWGNNGWPGLKK